MTRPARSVETPAFHDGEVSFHRDLGLEQRLDGMGRLLMRDHMPDQHRAFFAMLPMIHLSAIDAKGHPRAFMRVDEPGFATTPDEYTLVIKSSPLPGEPADLQLQQGSKISVVGLEFETRRRNRLNATIIRNDGDEIAMRVDQSYGNCPKYIQSRAVLLSEPQKEALVCAKTSILTAADIDLIAETDTLFIASRAPELGDDPRAGIDINHRGGKPGFIEVVDAETIRFADYKGNNFFNTFGNIVLDPRIDLQLLAFESGSLLNVKGRAEIVTLEGEFDLPDMGRRVVIRVEEIQRVEHGLPFVYEFHSYSPALSASR